MNFLIPPKKTNIQRVLMCLRFVILTVDTYRVKRCIIIIIIIIIIRNLSSRHVVVPSRHAL